MSPCTTDPAQTPLHVLNAACEVVTGLGERLADNTQQPRLYTACRQHSHLHVTPVVLQLVNGLVPHILQLILLLCRQQWRPSTAAVLLLLLLVKAPPEEAGL